jgi:hypothetical protein
MTAPPDVKRPSGGRRTVVSNAVEGVGCAVHSSNPAVARTANDRIADALERIATVLEAAYDPTLQAISVWNAE